MLTHIRMLTIFALLCCSLQRTIALDTTTGPRFCSLIPIAQCNDYIRENVEEIYDNDFDNFDKVIEFGQNSTNPNFEAMVLSALYNVMYEAHHTQDPLRALPLYNEIESLINTRGFVLYAKQLNEMESIRGVLLWETIVPRGDYILQAGVYLNKCAQENTTVGQLLDELDPQNQTVSELTITHMVNNVRWILPTEELITILSNFSNHLRQNVYAMLALYNEEEFHGDQQTRFFTELIQLQENPEYKVTVSAETRQRVNAIIPLSLQLLLDGGVCLHLKNRNYMQKCYLSFFACPENIIWREASHAFQATRKGQELIFNFKSPYHNNSLLSFDDIPLGLYVYYSVNGDIDWRVHLDGDKILVTNPNSTLYLCNHLSAPYAYTRDYKGYVLYPENCQWSVVDCRYLL